MSVRIATDLLDQIRAEAAASPGIEVCGLLLGRDDVVEEARACRNVAADPAHAFEIDPVALIAAHRAARSGGRSIVGCYHSHPSGEALPSARDALAAEPDHWLWFITAGGDLSAWRAVVAGQHHGRFDPVELRVA